MLTGAGITTDSGIPDFRGPKGVWTKDPKAEKTATCTHYMADPEVRTRSWQQPARAPRLDGRAERRPPRPRRRSSARGKLHTLVTQNIDGLHQAAGTDPARVVEVHGTMREVMCMTCDERAPMERALDRVRAGEDDPPCRTCGGILKSATISFGQNLVPDDLERAERPRARRPAARRRLDAGRVPGRRRRAHGPHAGARVVIVNGEPTAMDHLADAVLRGSISEILPASSGRDRARRYPSVTSKPLVATGICASRHPM